MPIVAVGTFLVAVVLLIACVCCAARQGRSRSGAPARGGRKRLHDEEETDAVVEKARDGHTHAVTDEVPIWVSPASLGKPKAQEATELSPASGFASILLPPKAISQ